jgi:hypothetical protein
VDRARSEADELGVRASRADASYESSPTRDDRLLFVLSVVCLVVVAAFAALWILVQIEFGLLYFILAALGLGAVLVVLWSLR